MGYKDILLGLLPPVSYARNAPRIRAQAEIDGQTFDVVAESAQSVADAIDPRTAGQMLSDWERVLGLDGTGKNRQRRVLAVMTKLNETGGLSIPYFVRLAAAADYQIKIHEPQPFRAGVNRAGDRLAPEEIMWVWHVNVRDGNNRITRFRAGISAAGERLTDYGDNVIEAIIQDLKPAHTAVHFTYETANVSN